ncbi:MAG: hypothetical protein KF758_00825 [Anaerolineales bacterium]|nr:hypothetical protein [Anaerolineales bacterium]MBX3035428.1 hypothetical protein [Anaerolineales bacterium]
MKVSRPFYFIVALVLIVSLACGIDFGNEPATQAPPPQQPQQEQPQQPQQQPTPEQQQQQQQQPQQPSSGPFFTEEFDSDPNWYYEVIKGIEKSDADKIKITFDDSLMIFEIPDPGLYAYYLYEGYEYDDVKITIKFENRGVNSQQVSLVCRAGDDGWYEWAVGSDGLWDLYAISGGYNRVTNGGSNDIKQGKDVNEYSMTCEGDKISFFINGKEQKGSPYTDRNYGFRKGSVGFSISSLNATPVKIEVDYLEISEP